MNSPMRKIVEQETDSNQRWQSKDHNVVFPFEEQIEKANKKNVILVVIYLTLLIGSLFTI